MRAGHLALRNDVLRVPDLGDVRNDVLLVKTYDHHVALRPDGGARVTTDITITSTEPPDTSNASSLAYITIYGPDGATLDQAASDAFGFLELSLAGHPATGWFKAAAPAGGQVTLKVVWDVPRLLERQDDGAFSTSAMHTTPSARTVPEALLSAALARAAAMTPSAYLSDGGRRSTGVSPSRSNWMSARSMGKPRTGRPPTRVSTARGKVAPLTGIPKNTRPARPAMFSARAQARTGPSASTYAYARAPISRPPRRAPAEGRAGGACP